MMIDQEPIFPQVTPHPDETLHLLARASDLLANGSNYHAMLDSIAKLLVSSLADWCSIDLVNDDGQIDRVCVAHRDPEKALLVQRVRDKYPPNPNAKRGVYRVISTGKSVLIPVLTEDEWRKSAESEDHYKLIMQLGSSSYMCVPLAVSNRIVGSIMLLSDNRVYTARDLCTAEHIASRISMAVDNVSMFRKMQATIDQLNATQQQLIQSTKMSTLGTVYAGIAHEVNNPLTVVKLYLEYIQNALEVHAVNDPNVLRYVEKANTNVERIVQIVNNIKIFSRQSDLSISRVNLVSLVELSIGLFEEQFRVQQIAIETDFPKEPVFLNADLSGLQQVFVNILSNARDAINAKHRGTGKIRVQIDNEDGSAIVRISDNGNGASQAVRDRVFEPFFTTKPVHQGTGLGLSISHGIIARHKGDISFESAEGQGSRVSVRLPMISH